MSVELYNWLIDKAPGLAAAVIAMGALGFSILSARRTAVRSRQPVLVFEYADDGWHVENVGNGPAIDILLAFRGDDMPWMCPLRIPPLAKDAKYHIKEIGHISVRHLGANYADSSNHWYSTLSVNDKNVVKRHRKLPSFEDSKITRYWHGFSFEDHAAELAYSTERRDSA